jgi:hypothetical protein
VVAPLAVKKAVVTAMGRGVIRVAFSIWGMMLFFGLIGCKSAPAPIIVGDTYTNIEYEYSLKIPQGWEPVETVPTAMTHFASLVNPEMCSLMLYNEETGGLIAVMNSANRIAYDQYFDISYKQWDKILLRLKASLEEDLTELSFNYTVHMENLYTTQQNYFVNQYAYKPEKVYSVDTRFKGETQKINFNFDSFLFPCRNVRSCEAIVILTCSDQNLTQNQQDFEAVLSSLRAHDYYD